MLEAAAKIDAAPDGIAAIRVETHPRWMSVCNQPAPETGLGAKFSYATVLPMHFLGHDTARLSSFSDALCADPQLQALRSRVTVVASEEVGEMQARLEVELGSGEVRRALHDLDAPLPAWRSGGQRSRPRRRRFWARRGPSGSRRWSRAGGAGRDRGGAGGLIIFSMQV
ncbi:MAG: hypothetical protein R3D85_08055 [Paracoccaceae bacterium]